MVLEYPVLSHAERDRRWGAIRSMLAAHSLDALILFGLKGRERFEGYVANEQIEGCAIVPRESEPVLLTWHPKMVIRRMGSKTDPSRFWIKETRIDKYGPAIVEVLKERGLEQGTWGWWVWTFPRPAAQKVSFLIRCGKRCSTPCRGRASLTSAGSSVR